MRRSTSTATSTTTNTSTEEEEKDRPKTKVLCVLARPFYGAGVLARVYPQGHIGPPYGWFR